MTKKKYDINSPMDILPSKYTEEEAAAQVAFQLQLRHTQDTINHALTDHPHFTDDCGDELGNSLDLSTYLTRGRQDGVEGLLGAMDDLLNPEHDMYVGNFVSYTSDGLMDYLVSRGFKDDE